MGAGNEFMTSSPVIRTRFRMNQDSKEFGRGLLESDFEFGLDIVDAGEREIVGERAVAGNIKASANFLDLNVVHVDDFWKMCGGRLQLPSRPASRTTSSPVSMVAGSLSMWVRMSAISGTSRRMSASSSVT